MSGRRLPKGLLPPDVTRHRGWLRLRWNKPSIYTPPAITQQFTHLKASFTLPVNLFWRLENGVWSNKSLPMGNMTLKPPRVKQSVVPGLLWGAGHLSSPGSAQKALGERRACS